MRRERLSLLIDMLGVKNTELAECCGFDRTNLSRIRSGARDISSESSTATKLVEGIYICAEEQEKLDILCSMLGSDPSISAEETNTARSDSSISAEETNTIRSGAALSDEEIKKEISSWLFEGEDTSGTKRKPRKRTASFRTFSERLDMVMNLTGISNSQLSQLINADASIISRYRTGVRVPTGVSGIAPKIAGALWDRISRDNKKKQLSDKLRLPEDYLDRDWFDGWLCEKDTEAESDRTFAEKMLGAFEMVRVPEGVPLPHFDDIIGEDIRRDDASVYTGTDGLRRAILRFLGNTAEKGSEKLLLYSDENLDWMTADQSFREKWALLMSACVRNGTKIRIIHNIRRDLDEMSAAIISWMPLYMSGMIESYYCTRSEESRFSHTLFLCPGEYCISASHVIGTESNGIYHYYTYKDELNICREQFDALLSISRPLVSMAPYSADRTHDPEADVIVSGNTEIVLNETSVQVTRLEPPTLSLVFGHPLMLRAFRVFAESLRS